MSSLIIAIILLSIPCASMARADYVDAAVISVIACEAGGETLDGQIAVASVIKTRMLDRGRSAYSIISAPKQFSCWQAGRVIRRITDREYSTARQAWIQARPGKYNHYYAHRLFRPYWARGAKLIKVIGNHAFVKL